MADSTGSAIPSVPPSDPTMAAFLQALKENVELLTANRNSQAGSVIAAGSATAPINSSSVISMSNYACVLVADASGTVASYASANGVLKVTAAGQDVTPLWQLSVFASNNCVGTINNAPNVPVPGQPLGYYQVTSLSANSGNLVLQAVSGTTVIQTSFNLAKALGGSAGPPGTGTGALSLELSNVAIVLPAYANGSVSATSYGTAVGMAKMFNGTTDVTASATFSASMNNCTGSINTAANTPVNNQPKGYYQITAMTAQSATFTISGVYSGATITQVVNIVLAQGGFEIVSSMPITNLFQGRVVFYVLDNKLYRYDGNAWVTWVLASDIQGQINAAQIQDGVITTAKLLPGLSPVILVTTLPPPGIAGRIVYLTADSQLYRDTGVAWTTSILANSIQGQIPGSQLVANSITAGQIQAGAITTNAMAANSITGDRISAGSLDASKIAANSITAGQLKANSVTALAIQGGTITGDKIFGGTITGAQIAGTTITAANLSGGVLITNTAQIGNGVIQTANIGSLQVQTANIADLTVQTAKIANAAVTSTSFVTLARQDFLNTGRSNNGQILNPPASIFAGLSITVSLTGGPCLIFYGAAQQGFVHGVGLYRDGIAVNVPGFDIPAAGVHTYTILWQMYTYTTVTGAGVPLVPFVYTTYQYPSGYLNGQYLVVMELKK